MLEQKSIVLLATDLSTGGGVNRVIRDLSVIFSADLGLRTTVVVGRSGAQPTYPMPEGVTLEFHPGGSRLLSYLRLLWRLRKRNYDYAIGFWPEDNVLLALMFLFSRARVLLAEHVSWYYPRRVVRLLRRVLYPTASCVVVLNRAELAHYRGYLRNVALVPNPVPAMKGTCQSRDKLVLGVGHLTDAKGFGDLLSAMARSGLERLGWRLVIVGGGPQEKFLKDEIRRLGLVRTEVQPPTAEIAVWYSQAAIIVVPSKIEVFSLVLAEATQAGAVPIAYATDGPSFLLEGFPEHLVPVGDVTKLAAAMVLLAQSSNLAEVGRAIGEAIRTRFSRQRVAELWRELLS